MKLILVIFLLFAMMLQISCGPRTSSYRGSYTPSLVDSKTGFNDALFSERLLLIRKFIVSGVDINSKVESGLYPLEYAVRFNKLKSLEFLLKNKADPNLKDPVSGQTALFSAASLEAINLMLKYGADVSIKDSNNRTAYDVVDKSIRDVLSTGLVFSSVSRGDLNKYIKENLPLSKKDHQGDTALHVAAKKNHVHIIKYLLQKGIAVNAKNKNSETALDLVKDTKNLVAKLLSCKQNKHCKSVRSFTEYISVSCSVKSSRTTCQAATSKDIHGVFTSNKILDQIAGLAFSNSCEKFSYTKCYNYSVKYSNSKYFNKAKRALESFKTKGELLFAKKCGETGTKWACKKFIETHKGLIEESRSNHAILVLSQACRVNEDGWIYQGKQCKGSWVHGEGKSVNSEKNLSFIGLYRNGKRVKGLVSYNNQPMFDGVISNGRPNGEGICFYKGDPEKCEFYKGKRVDVIFKQRLANAEQERKMDAKLAEMKRMQEQQNARISQIQGQVRSNKSQVTNKSSGGIGKQIGDYALKKAGEKVMDSLFDRLF